MTKKEWKEEEKRYVQDENFHHAFFQFLLHWEPHSIFQSDIVRHFKIGLKNEKVMIRANLAYLLICLSSSNYHFVYCNSKNTHLWEEA